MWTTPPADRAEPARESDWRATALLFALASVVETLGFGHLGAFTPLYLRELGVPAEAIPQWTGLLAAASFVLGLPLAPLWGVWADRYSRKLIIVRSTLGEGLIFFLFAVADAPWQLLLARTLVGFILGNTGVMYAMLAYLAPRHQLATAIGFISAGSTLGMSVGPFVGGWLATWIGLSNLYLLDAAACWLVGVLLIVVLRERRTGARPTASTLELLRALPRNVRATPLVLPLFGLHFAAFFGLTMAGPFVPLLVEEVYSGAELPVAIGGAMLVSGILSALAAPLLGRAGGWFGHGRVLTLSLAASAAATLGHALASDYGTLLATRAALGLAQGATGPLIVAMIAQATPEDRRASILNITLFPSYLAWLFGAMAGSAIAALSIRAVFVAGAGATIGAAGAGFAVSRQASHSAEPTANDGPLGRSP